MAALAVVGGDGERGIGGGDCTPRPGGDERLVGEGDDRPLHPQFGGARQSRLERARRATPPLGIDDGRDPGGQVGSKRAVAVGGDDREHRPDPAGGRRVERPAQQAAPVDLGVELVPRPGEATPLAGGENDGDGGLAHAWSLPGRTAICGGRHASAVDRVTGCLRNDVVRS